MVGILVAVTIGLYVYFSPRLDTTHPPVVLSDQYWGTFYYPWYGTWQFEKNPATPLSLGKTEPDVIQVGTEFYMYYRTDSSIAVAKSADGLVWEDVNTVLEKSLSGWDSGEVIAPSVVGVDRTYYLFYEGEDAENPGHRAVGVATSTDPVGPFSKYGGNPVLSPTAGWEGTIVGTPVVANVGSRFHMFYHGFSGGSDRIGVAYSQDLLAWTKEGDNPVLNIGQTGSWDSDKVAPSSVYVSGSVFWLFYEGFNGASWRIGVGGGMVNQTDFRVRSMAKHPSPVLELGLPGSFDDDTVQLPSIILSPDGTQFWMYYSGNDGAVFRLGRAVASVQDTLRHWKDPFDNNCLPCSHNPPGTWSSMYLPDDGSGSFNPVSQLYNSLSTSLIDRHLTWMDYARFDFALVSWWGKDSFEERVFQSMLARAQLNASLHLKLAVYYELEGNNVLQPTVEDIVHDLTYIYDQRANFTSYFKVGSGSYPVVFVFGDPSDSVDYATRWSQARERMYALGKPMFVVLKVFEGYNSNGTDLKVDGWHQYGPAVPYESHSPYSAYASPGYLEYPELATARGRCGAEVICSQPYQSFPRDLPLFRSNVTKLASLPIYQAKFLLIETFNEWHEGSQIESGTRVDHPCCPDGNFSPTVSSYGFTFLSTIRIRGS